MRRMFLLLGFASAVLGTAAPASAQFQPPRPRQERPERGIFGSGMSNTEHRLVLNASFGGGYDNDPFGQVTGTPPPAPGVAPRGVGQYGFLSAGLDYRLSRETVNVSANVGGTGQYYPDLQNPRIFSLGAGLQASWQITPRTTLSTSNQFTSQPNSLRTLYGVAVDAQTPPDSIDTLNYAIGRVSYEDLRSSIGFTQGITAKLAAELGYTYYMVDYNSSVQSAYQAQTISGRLTYQITKSLSAYGGLARTSTDYDNDLQTGRYSGNMIDAGVNFGKALSLTRRTSLSFATGVSGIQYADETHYFFTGSVTLTHELGRSWTLTTEARRATNFYQTFGEPVVSDSVTGGVSGLLNRRVQAGANAGWSRGTMGVLGGAPEFDSWFAGGSMRFALARNAGLSFNYSLFRYVFDENEGRLPFGVEGEMRNQSVRVTFDWMMPLVTVARRANASR
jgi:hypothetical protein